MDEIIEKAEELQEGVGALRVVLADVLESIVAYHEFLAEEIERMK